MRLDWIRRQAGQGRVYRSGRNGRRQGRGAEAEGRRLQNRRARRISPTHYVVGVEGIPVGEVTSGAFSPTLGENIGLALVEAKHAGVGKPCKSKSGQVDCRRAD